MKSVCASASEPHNACRVSIYQGSVIAGSYYEGRLIYLNPVIVAVKRAEFIKSLLELIRRVHIAHIQGKGNSLAGMGSFHLVVPVSAVISGKRDSPAAFYRLQGLPVRVVTLNGEGEVFLGKIRVSHYDNLLSAPCICRQIFRGERDMIGQLLEWLHFFKAHQFEVFSVSFYPCPYGHIPECPRAIETELQVMIVVH